MAVPKEAKRSSGLLSKSDNPERWVLPLDALINLPSLSTKFLAADDRLYRQQAATLIQDIGHGINVQPLVTNTAIVYMHRFFCFHSFAIFDRFVVAACCVFLACKVEEQPRKLEHVIAVFCKQTKVPPPFHPKTEEYRKRTQQFIMHEQLVVETLGFDSRVEHPHSHVIKITEKIKASKDLAQTSYLLATNSLYLTTFCLTYTPVVVACVCINLACKWGNWMIPKSNEKKEWWQYFAPSDFTSEKLDALTDEFVDVIEKSPARMKDHLKRKICSKNTEKYQPEVTKKADVPKSKSIPSADSVDGKPDQSEKFQAVSTSNFSESGFGTRSIKSEPLDSEASMDGQQPTSSTKTEISSSDQAEKKKSVSLSEYKERKSLVIKSEDSKSPISSSSEEPKQSFPQNSVDRTPITKHSKVTDEISPGTESIKKLLKSGLGSSSKPLASEHPSPLSVSVKSEPVDKIEETNSAAAIADLIRSDRTITPPVLSQSYLSARSEEVNTEPDTVGMGTDINELIKSSSQDSLSSSKYSILSGHHKHKKHKDHKEKKQKKSDRHSKHSHREKIKVEYEPPASNSPPPPPPPLEPAPHIALPPITIPIRPTDVLPGTTLGDLIETRKRLTNESSADETEPSERKKKDKHKEKKHKKDKKSSKDKSHKRSRHKSNDSDVSRLSSSQGEPSQTLKVKIKLGINPSVTAIDQPSFDPDTDRIQSYKRERSPDSDTGEFIKRVKPSLSLLSLPMPPPPT